MAKRTLSPKSLANLKRGGNPQKARGLTLQHKLFLAYLVKLGKIGQAAELADLHYGMARLIVQRPEAKEFMKVAEQEMDAELLRHANQIEFVSVQFLDKHLKRNVKQSKSLHASNDALEIGYKRVGLIESNGSVNVSANANSQSASVTQNATMKEVLYKSRWLRDKETDIMEEFAKQENDKPLLSGSTQAFSE